MLPPRWRRTTSSRTRHRPRRPDGHHGRSSALESRRRAEATWTSTRAPTTYARHRALRPGTSGRLRLRLQRSSTTSSGRSTRAPGLRARSRAPRRPRRRAI
eukprot:6993072-Heterocapsa_arctica.AAC.1